MAAERHLPLETLPPGTEFPDAETGGQKSTRETVISHRDLKAELNRRISPQKRPVSNRRPFVRFGRTGWWCAQSHANRSQPASPCYSLLSAFFQGQGFLLLL